jgi:hypothetical protein
MVEAYHNKQVPAEVKLLQKKDAEQAKSRRLAAKTKNQKEI